MILKKHFRRTGLSYIPNLLSTANCSVAAPSLPMLRQVNREFVNVCISFTCCAPRLCITTKCLINSGVIRFVAKTYKPSVLYDNGITVSDETLFNHKPKKKRLGLFYWPRPLLGLEDRSVTKNRA